jgi:chromosome segregation ATPase
VEYEEWFNDPLANIERLQKFLDLHWQQAEVDLGLVLSGVIDPALRHNDSDHREANLNLVRTLDKLARDVRDEVRDQISYFVSRFVAFQQLQRPLLDTFEDVAKTAAKLPEIEREATALRAAVGECDPIVEDADQRAKGAEARLAEAVAKIEAQRAQIAELARKRDVSAEAEREASELRAKLAEREMAFAELSYRADELLADQKVAQAELAAREAALRYSQSEIAALRGAVARAEREAHRFAAAQAMLQSETVALRGRLDAARRVANAAIAAVRTSSAAPKQLDSSVHSIMRSLNSSVAARVSEMSGWIRSLMLLAKIP